MRILKGIGKFFLAFLLLVLIAWTIILGTLQTKTGQEWAFNTVLGYFEQATHTKIKVKKFYFTFPLSMGVEDVVFLQDDRPILTMKRFELCCAYTTLLQGRIVFSHVRANHIDVLDLPKPAEATQTNSSSRPWEIPPLPFYVKLENVDIQKLRINPNLLQNLKLPPEIDAIVRQSTFNLNGVVSNNPFKSALAAHLLITAKNKQKDLTPFSLGVDTQNHQLSLSFHANQIPMQMLHADLAEVLKGHLALYASAPVSTWQNLLENSSQNRDPIEGHFKLSLHTLPEDRTLISSLVGKQTIFKGHYVLQANREIELYDLKVENPNFSLMGEAVLNADQVIEQGSFKGQIEELAHFQPLLEKNVQGSLSFEGHASGHVLAPLFVMHVETPKIMIADQSFQQIRSTLQTLPEENNLKGFFSLTFDYQDIPWKASSAFDWRDQTHLTLSHLQIDGLRTRLFGEVNCLTSDFIWDGFLEAHADNLNDLSHFLTFPISGEGQVKLQLNSTVNHQHQKQQAFRAEFLGRALRWTDWQAQQVMFNLNFNPLPEGKARFAVEGTLQGEQLKWKDYFVAQTSSHFSHHIDLDQHNLSHLTAKWEAQDMKWLAGQAAHAQGQFQLDDPIKFKEGQIEFAIHELKTPTIQMQELTGMTRFHQDQRQWPFNLKGRGIWKEDLLFAIEGQWHYQPDNLEIQTERLGGRFGPYPLELKRPLHFQYMPDEIHLGSLWLQWGEAELQGEFHRNKNQVSSQFKTNAVPSELFHFVAPELPLAGRATFEGALAGPIDQPNGHLQIDLHQIQIIEDVFAKKPFIAGKLMLNFDEKGVQLNSELKGLGTSPLRIAGQLPFHLSLEPIELKIQPHLPFQLALNAEGELDPYLHLFYNDTTNLSGHAKIALTFSGQINAPQIKGNIDLVNGSYESLSTGALYHNIQAHLEGDGTKVVLTKLSAQDNKNGQIAASGVVNLDASKQFPFDFQIHPSHIFIVDSDYVDISASGHLNLIGNTKQAKLQGELTVDQANIHLEQALPNKIKNIDIKYINLAEGDPALHYFEKREASSPLELSIKLNAPQNVRVEGNHLKSEWKGSLFVTGTPDNLLLNGDMRIAKGEYDFNGKIFNLSQGNIHFAGAVDKKTSLYVIASKDIDRITAEIIVKGPVTKPVISFRSNPPLSQREVLSYILFNTGISDITPDQGDQLSQSFIALNSNEQTKSSDDFLSRLRNNIGIDRLDFTTNSNNENKDFGLQVGKHLTENIMVSVKQSVVSLSPIIEVEAKLRKNIKAQAEAGVAQDAPIRMSIKWKKDY